MFKKGMSSFYPTTLYYMEISSGNVETPEVRWVLMSFPDTKLSLEILKLNYV